MNEKNIRYVHEEIVHNFSAAREMVPFIMKLIEPESVVDVGCGTGTWLKVFEENGVKDILGIDGDYVDKKLLKIDLDKFVDHDLQTFFKIEKKYDLAISLEVAEHLSEISADVFVETLSESSDIIIFSAAITNQGGQNHLNEQEPQYWIEKFENLGFSLFDILRPVFWNNKNVDAWYRQNVLLFTKNEDLMVKLASFDSFNGKHLVHPLLAEGKDNILNYHKRELGKIENGKKEVRFYINLFFKYLRRKFI